MRFTTSTFPVIVAVGVSTLLGCNLTLSSPSGAAANDGGGEPAADAGTSDDATSGDAAPAVDAGVDGASERTVIVVGPLAQPAAQEQATHDGIFNQFRAQAAAAGDVGHTVFLNSDDPTTTMLNVDTWNNPAGLAQFLSDPNVQKADSQLFSAPPTLIVATKRDGWYGWGTFSRTLSNGSPANVALIRGTLASNPQAAMGVHNQGAQQAQSSAQQAGDVAHIVLQDTSNPQAFLVIDEWTDPAAARAVYGSSSFQEGFASLLSGPPSITIFEGTSWVQW
jgi:quinol monooxygenase YgiN